MRTPASSGRSTPPCYQRAVAVTLTRRSLLVAGAGALAGAAGLSRLPLAAGRAADAATDLRRCVVLGPAGGIFAGSPQDYTRGANAAFFRQTRTRWLRLWADWPTLEPARGEIDAEAFARLDAQVAAARRDGLRIVLTIYRFPTWANGYDAGQADAYTPDRRTQNQSDAQAKQAVFRIPADVSPGSDWGRFCDRLLARYGRGNLSRPALDAAVDVLEICNEPNLQWWPQQTPNPADPYASDATRITVHQTVARMFATAQQLAAARPPGPVLAGPACADTPNSNRLSTGYASFTNRLLDELDALGFRAGAGFAYTHHNYTDVLNDRADFATDLLGRLAGRWRGWPAGDAASPGLLLTEGGATLDRVQNLYPGADARAKQAELIQNNWDRMSAAPGIAMISNYLWYTDPRFDSGLCDASEAGGAPRPAYATWGALPSRA